MSFSQVLSFYLSANILLCVGFLFCLAMVEGFKFLGHSLQFKAELKLHYTLLTAIAVIACATPLLPKNDLFKPVAKVWAAPTKEILDLERIEKSQKDYSVIQSGPLPEMPLNKISSSLAIAILLILAFGLGKLVRDLRRLLRLNSEGFLIREIKSVRVFVSAKVTVPLSFWLPRQKNIVLPETLIGSPNFRSAVMHELQHHRQGDTRWVYLLWGMRFVFFPNPFVHLWNKWISEVQEFACDEALVDQGKVESLAYASCLVQVAQTALNHECPPVCATGLVFMVERNMLKRRITAMLEQKKKKLSFKAILPILGLTIAIVGATAYASQGLVQDRRITSTQAEEMARVASKSGTFPIVVNDQVVKWLNYYLSTPDGREKVKAALARMENYRPAIEKKLEEYQLPEELLAIPLIEAGYQNIEPKQNRVRAAGLWQFIASTAQNFGLKVDDQVDERMNVDLETDAAMRYLLANKLRFKDWQLSILAYNAGEATVQGAIAKTGSRDPWVLVRSGFTSDESSNYLPKLMAAVLIIRNPGMM